MNKIIVMLCCLVVAIAGGATRVDAGDSLLDWAAIFTEDGSVRSLNGGIEAVFLQDNISAGVATDMTALSATGNFVYNGTVPAIHDLGNGYAYAALDAERNRVVYAGVERLNSTGDTFVEFELNQDVVGVNSGAPWPIHGARTINDCLVRLNFTAGVMDSFELKRWDGSGYSTVQSGLAASPTGCFVMSDSCSYCVGTPIPGLPPTNADVWDSAYKIVQTPSADSFVQVSINVGRLFGADVEFTSIAMRSPEDIVLGSFRAMGFWGSLSKAPAVQ